MSQSGEINYDMRSHDKVIEENRLMAIEKLSTLKLEIENISADHDLVLNANYSINEDTHLPIRTSLYRALQYNIEHSIHHMIIKMVLLSDFELVSNSLRVCIAYSQSNTKRSKMCTVTFLPKGKNDYILTSNRDETPTRAALEPKALLNRQRNLFSKRPFGGWYMDSH